MPGSAYNFGLNGILVIDLNSLDTSLWCDGFWEYMSLFINYRRILV